MELAGRDAAVEPCGWPVRGKWGAPARKTAEDAEESQDALREHPEKRIAAAGPASAPDSGQVERSAGVRVVRLMGVPGPVAPCFAGGDASGCREPYRAGKRSGVAAVGQPEGVGRAFAAAGHREMEKPDEPRPVKPLADSAAWERAVRIKSGRDVADRWGPSESGEPLAEQVVASPAVLARGSPGGSPLRGLEVLGRVQERGWAQLREPLELLTSTPGQLAQLEEVRAVQAVRAVAQGHAPPVPDLRDALVERVAAHPRVDATGSPGAALKICAAPAFLPPQLRVDQL